MRLGKRLVGWLGGALCLAPYVNKFARSAARALDLGGYADFLAAHSASNDTSWVHVVTEYLEGTPPLYVTVLFTSVGIGLLYVALKRSGSERANSKTYVAPATSSSMSAETSKSLISEKPKSSSSIVIQAVGLPTQAAYDCNEFTQKDVTYFSSFLKANPLQAEKLFEPYVGLKIPFSGALCGNSINPFGNEYIVGVIVNGGQFHGGISLLCFYPNKFRNYLMRLDADELMCGVGTISEISLGSLVLRNCYPTEAPP